MTYCYFYWGFLFVCFFLYSYSEGGLKLDQPDWRINGYYDGRWNTAQSDLFFLLLIGCFHNQEKAQTAERNNWAILFHIKNTTMSVALPSCLISSANSLYPPKQPIHHTLEKSRLPLPKSSLVKTEFENSNWYKCFCNQLYGYFRLTASWLSCDTNP